MIYVEAERRGNPVSEESDILRELLLENELASPHQFSSGSTKSVSSGKRSHVDISIPPICFESAQIQRLQPPPSIRGTPSLLHTPTGGHSLFFGSSSLSSSSLSSSLLHSSSTSSSSTPSSQIINAIISPPRVFIQEFARLPPPFFHDSILDNDNCDARPVKSIPSPPSSSTMSSTAVTPSSTTVSPHRLTSFPLLS
ncbi:TPA: hypothetical protein N0F65_012584 [Lagenidium giganteum]|uniref:Uncharacterized protein n=1 Tax=Lagenidium giganteum TaxID=4803 RepID=A0AAV2YSN3_9STRA|nr:TPA: hypothetical protein N0F65_012584 [Lagenidium giganteum]